MQQETSGTGGIDWCAYWQQMYDAEHAQADAVFRNDAGNPDPQDRWAGRAERYVAATDRATQPDAFMRLLLPHLRADDTVLDIGAGAGRYALVLAQHVARVIAVERSPTMRRHLEQRMAEQQVSNIDIIPAAWPDAVTADADIAICSHVVYGVREIEPFLRQMHARARRGGFIVAGFRQPSYILSPFWERIYGEARLPLPGALECLNVLYQLGIAAQLSHIPASRYLFADSQEVVADLRWRLRLPSNPTTDAVIQQAIVDLLEHDEAGRLSPRGQPAHSAVLWWL